MVQAAHRLAHGSTSVEIESQPIYWQTQEGFLFLLITVVHFPVVALPLGGFAIVQAEVEAQDPSGLTLQSEVGTKWAACSKPAKPGSFPHVAVCRYMLMVTPA